MDWITYLKTDENKALKEIYLLYREKCCVWLQKEMKLEAEECIEIFQVSVVILYDNVINRQVD